MSEVCDCDLLLDPHPPDPKHWRAPDRECTACGTIAPETTMEFEQGSQWNRGTFRCYDTDACDRRASGLYVTGDYDDMERGTDGA